MAKKNEIATDETENPECVQDTAQAESEGVRGESFLPNRFPKGGSPLAAGGLSLETVDELASRHRVPTWQQSALVRMTGWTEGKSVSETEFLAALSALSARPMGGGRR